MLLQTHGLAKSFKGLTALAGVDVEVRRGEILGLLGPNGPASRLSSTWSADTTAHGRKVVFEGHDIPPCRPTASHVPASHALTYPVHSITFA